MKYSIKVNLSIIVIFLFAAIGCSSAKNSPISQIDEFNAGDDIPLIAFQRNDGYFTALGLMGAYDLMIDKADPTAEVTSKRNMSLGQSYVVNGVGFFTITPCSDCLKIRSVELTPDDNIKLNFHIRHPFPKGDIFKPPSAMNRLDLDIFDLALLIRPNAISPETYILTEAAVYDDFVKNPSGYTRELATVIGDPAAIPFFLVIDDSITGESTYNKFEMGSEADFSVVFDFDEPQIMFDLFLTMGYGASATRPTRLDPMYFNPEFNRKNAWKVYVSVSGNWKPNDNSTTNDVTVRIYDWQTGANVNPELLNPTDIYAASEVSSVSVEIPGMLSSLKVATEPDTPSSGYPDDPLVFTFPIANENSLGTGEYEGLVKVTDERVPPSDPVYGQIDALVDVPDGITISYKSIPEFATYQTFPVIVEAAVEPAVVTSITPNSGVVDEYLANVVIRGSNINAGATVELEYSPGDVITGENVEWIDDTEIHADFDLTGATLGKYDVKVTNPLALPGILDDGFEVMEFEIIMWQVTQGNRAHTGYKEGLNGPTGILGSPTWTSVYSIGGGNALATFLNDDTAFYSMSVNFGTYLPLVAVNLSDGSTKWMKSFGTETGDSLQVKGLSEDGSVVICSQRLNNYPDIIYGLDAATGDEKWNMTGEMRVSAYPTLDLNGNFIIPMLNVGFRSVVPDTGAINWTASVGNPDYCTPAVGANNVVYGYTNGSTNAHMRAIYAATGDLKWTIDSSASYVGVCHNSVVVHPNGNIIIHSQNGLYCLYDNGSYPNQVWRRTAAEYPYPWYCSNAVGPDGNIYIIDYNGVLRKINPADGATIQSTSGWGNGYGLMIALGDDGLIYTNGGTGSGFNTYTGRFRCHNTDLTERWVYNGDHYGGGFGAPAIGMNGVVYASKRELGLCAWHD